MVWSKNPVAHEKNPRHEQHFKNDIDNLIAVFFFNILFTFSEQNKKEETSYTIMTRCQSYRR